MTSKFEILCAELNLNINAPSEVALDAIKKWYNEHVSCKLTNIDIIVAVKQYLDVFLANIPDNIADSVPIFDNMNAVQYAAANGYDLFLDKLTPPAREVCNFAIERNGMAPLHLAASFGHVGAVKVLLKIGADPTQKNKMGQCPIYSALFTPISADSEYCKRKIEIFTELQRVAPATISNQDISGDTVAKLAVINGYESIVEDLIGSNLSSLKKHDNFIKYPIHYAVLNNKSGVISLLMTDPEMAKFKDSDGMVALRYAARSGNIEVLNACLSAYDEINIRDLNRKTPLLHAAESGNFVVFKSLINHKADINAKDYRDSGVLHYATISGNLELVSWILDNLSLDINMPDIDGFTSLDYASKRRLDDICILLVEHGAAKGVHELAPR